MKTQTIPSVTPQAQAFYKAAEDMMCKLMARWLDEHEYENIADYQKLLEPIATACGVTTPEEMEAAGYGLAKQFEAAKPLPTNLKAFRK